MNILRTLKWILFWTKTIALFLLGRLVRALPREPDSIVLTGDVDYSGGTLVYFLALMRALSSSGYRVSILIPRRFYRNALLEHAREANARLFVLPDRIAVVEQLAAFWRVCHLRAARVVVSASGPGTWTMALLWAIPSIHVFHSIPGKSVSRRSRDLIRYFFRAPHRAVGVSEKAREAICRAFRIPPRSQQLVRTIHNGTPDLISARRCAPRTENLVVTAGHVALHKNPDTWLLAARYVLERAQRKPRFVWAGDGPDLMEYRRKSEGIDGIQFIGYFADLASLLAKAAVYYQPSRMESFGLTVAQALSMGIPCVVSDRGGLPELVQHGKNGFVCLSTDFEAQGRALVRLLDDHSLRKSMSREARRIYLERFTVERWEREMLSVIRGSSRAGAAS